METTANTLKIETGRRIRYTGDVCNHSGEGVITAVYGTPGTSQPKFAGNRCMMVISDNDVTFDVVLFDGRTFPQVREHSLSGIGSRFRLLDRLHGPALIAATERNSVNAKIEKITAAQKARTDFEAAEAARVIDKAPLFYYNGIKDAKGEKLQKAHYTIGGYTSYPEATITIYARDYHRFSALVNSCFAVKNDTDTMTDYFDHDKIRVIPSHPLYAAVLAAFNAQQARRSK